MCSKYRIKSNEVGTHYGHRLASYPKMSTVQLTKESHQDPFKFRCKYDQAEQILGPERDIRANDALATVTTSSKITIVGGGFGGLCAALACIKDLKEDDFTIFDKHANFGGTWYANTYPGCALDIPAVWYSFFSELNKNWSALRPPQFEMEEYILTVVRKFELDRHARFETVVLDLKWRESTAEWVITGRHLGTGQKFEHTTQLLVMLQGGLVYPNQLKVPGLDRFEGDYMHSALWKHNVSFKGKDVVVVGNGCSAAQVIPALLEEYEPKLIVQVVRSKHWILPPLPGVAYQLYRLLSFHRWGIIFVRWLIATIAELKYPLFVGTGWWALAVRWVNTKQALSYMRKTTPPEYHNVVIPDYKIGCKRMIYDYLYLPLLHDPRIDLTDDQIDHIEPHHVVLKSGRRVHADIIVACTGYDLNRTFGSFRAVGRDGKNVQDVWLREGAAAYETILLKECPNLFVLGGPNAATGHSLVVLALENGAAFFTRVARKVLDGTYRSVCVKPAAYDEWNVRIQKRLRKMVFGTAVGGCVSWYTSGGRNTTAYPYSQVWMWWTMRHPKWGDFDTEMGDKKQR